MGTFTRVTIESNSRHLHPQHRNSRRSLSSTYLTFSDDGNELLVNMGGEQIYLFDINNPKDTKTCFGYSTNTCLDGIGDLRLGCTEKHEDTMDFIKKDDIILPSHVEEIKCQANESFKQQKYNLAISLYNKAISYWPVSGVLYANRAAAYMKRSWDGDIYAALKDCESTLLLDPGHVKAHFRLARCLFDLNRPAEANNVIKDFQTKFPEYAAKYACKALIMDIKEALESGIDNDTYQTIVRTSEFEEEWRRNTIDYKIRFYGHCNTTTDIKEANFFGNNGQYIVAGSDDGSFFVWDRSTTNIIRALRGEERVVNCLQPHPSTCLLATSGIDPVVRLWSPLPEDGNINDREIQDLEDVVSANYIRMNRDPFEVMLTNMVYRLPVQGNESYEDTNDDQEEANIQSFNCRPS